MNLPQDIQGVLSNVYESTKPVSIFVYGSQAKGDNVENSDFEVGVLYYKDSKVGRSELSEMHAIENLRMYPFIHEDFIKYNLDTPFPLATYMRSLLDGGSKTVYGDKTVESMTVPQILVSDLLEEISFQIARAVGSLLSFRQKDMVTATDQFVKSVLYGSQVYIVDQKGKYILRYDEIVEQVIGSELDEEYKKLVTSAMKIRKSEEALSMQMIFTAISYLNQIVRRSVKQQMRQGNKVMLEGVEIV